jgi:hypothetical protein
MKIGLLQVLVFGITGHANVAKRSFFSDDIQQFATIFEPGLKLCHSLEGPILQLSEQRFD